MRKFVLFIALTLFSLEILACAALTSKGTMCKRAPVPGSLYCWQHGGKATSSSSAQTKSRAKSSIKVSRLSDSANSNGASSYSWNKINADRTASPRDQSDVVVRLPKDERSDEDWTLAKLRLLDTKLREYIAKGHNPPTDLSQFKRFASLSFSDQWGTPFRYVHGTDNYSLSSAGADKVFGTDDDISLSYELQ